jgi:F0F1-type ATP synthase alpha subunit
VVSIDGFGTNRIFGVYIGINQNLSKLLKSFSFLSYYSFINSNLGDHRILFSLCLFLATHSASSSLLSFMIPLIGISIGERVRDRGNDICLCFDDLSKHSKSYRQLSLILAKIPSREAFPSDIFNIHSSLLERCGKFSAYYFGGSISSFPLIETINSDITEYIATNVISITDGQFYTNKRLFLDCCRPAIDSGLSVSRIGSNAQCKLMKTLSVGIKNELTYFRIMELSNVDFSISLNNIFCQDQMFISAIESSMILVLLYRNSTNNLYSTSIGLFLSIHSLFLLFLLIAIDYLYLYYIIAITKNLYSYSIYSFIIYWFFSSFNSRNNINSLVNSLYS